jgi:uncharacterized protein (TIGR00251 family)
MILKVNVIPKSSKDEIIGWTDDKVLKVKINALPVAGAANKRLITLLSKKFNLPKSRISIKKGGASRKKTIELMGIDAIRNSTLAGKR